MNENKPIPNPQEVQAMKQQKTWFFEKNGEPFAVNEKEAWELVSNKSTWRTRDIKMIGCSDGTAYYNTVKDAGSRRTELKGIVDALKLKLNKLIAAHDKLMFEEFLDDKNERVQRAKKLIADVETELEPLDEELKSLSSGLIRKAFEAELEAARNNKEMPRNFDVQVKAERGLESIAEQFKKSIGV